MELQAEIFQNFYQQAASILVFLTLDTKTRAYISGELLSKNQMAGIILAYISIYLYLEQTYLSDLELGILIFMQLTSKNSRRFQLVVLKLLRCEKSSFWCIFSWPTHLGGRLTYETRQRDLCSDLRCRYAHLQASISRQQQIASVG